MSNARKRDLGSITKTLVPARSPTKSIQLPEATERELEEFGVAFDSAKSRTFDSILEMGSILKNAHNLHARHGNGGFGEWVVKRCGISRQSAFNYIRVFEVFSRKDCKRLCQTSSFEVLYFIARKATPEEAIEEAVRFAEQGTTITLQKAKEIVKRYIVEESKGETTDESAAAGDTAEGAGEPDTAADTEEGADQDAAPSMEEEDFNAGAVDDQSYLPHFARSVRRAIELWSISCNEDEILKFPRVLRDLADELEAATSPPVFNDLDS